MIKGKTLGEQVNNIKEIAKRNLNFCEMNFTVDGKETKNPAQLQILKDILEEERLDMKYGFECQIVPRYISRDASIIYRMNVALLRR